MTKDHIVAFNMFLSIENLCSENYLEWKENYGFRTAFHLFSGWLRQVRSQIKKLENFKPVRVENHEQFHLQLEELTCTVAGALLVYALTHDLYDLIENLDFHRKDIKELSSEKLIKKAQEVLDLSIIHAAKLKAYDINLSMLGHLEQAIENFQSSMNREDLTHETYKKFEERLDELFRETKTVIRDHLDQQIITFKWSDRHFYDLYTNVRGNKPIYSVPLQGSVIDDATHLPVGNADIIIPELNISRHITPLGHFIFYNLPPGRYHARVHKFGYEDRIIEVNIPENEGEYIDIEMHHI